MGKVIEFRPAWEPEVGYEEAYDALGEADALVEFAKGAFPEDSVDYVALGRCQMVFGGVMRGMEIGQRLSGLGIEPQDRTYVPPEED